MDIDDLKCEVSITDMPIFNNLIALLKTIETDDEVPLKTKNNIAQYLKDINKQPKINNIVCQNCGAILATNEGTTEKIFLPEGLIKFEGKKVKLHCNCGCETEYINKWL